MRGHVLFGIAATTLSASACLLTTDLGGLGGVTVDGAVTMNKQSFDYGLRPTAPIVGQGISWTHRNPSDAETIIEIDNVVIDGH